MPQVIYLDQNHWITLARGIHRPEKVQSAPEREAALWLADVLRSGVVVSPLSMAHVLETQKIRSPERRRLLGETMIELGGGVFMSPPNMIQLQEWSTVLADCPDALPTREAVFRPYPEALTGLEPLAVPAALLDFERFVAREQFHEILCAVEVSEEVAAPGRVALDDWVEEMVRVGNVRSSQHLGRREITLASAYRLIQEVSTPLVERGVPEEQIIEYHRSIARDRGEQMLVDLRRLPYAARFSEVIAERWLIDGDRWTDHDLFDLMYLSCAAGYADYVVSEKKMGHLLREVRHRVPAGAVGFSRLRDLRAHLGG